MAIHESDQIIDINLGSTGTQKWLDKNDLGARFRIGVYKFNTTDNVISPAVLAEADTVELVRIPKGSRIFGIEGYNEAMGTDQIARIGIKGADGSGTFDCAGTADDPIFFTNDLTNDGIDVAAVGEYKVGVSQLGNFLYITEKEVIITMTLFDVSSSDPFDADKDFDGVVYYTNNT